MALCPCIAQFNRLTKNYFEVRHREPAGNHIMENIKVSCPKCHWEPDGKPHWSCDCGYSWDTFSTGGRCPHCKKVWEWTQCISCATWSAHLDWYHGLDDILKRLEEEIKQSGLPAENRQFRVQPSAAVRLGYRQVPLDPEKDFLFVHDI